MSYAVVYRTNGLPRVREFGCVCKAMDFAYWADGKVYFLENEKDRHNSQL